MINISNNTTKKQINHRLSDLLYSNQAVVLLLCLLPLILTSQLFSKICFIITASILFLLAFVVDKFLNDNLFKIKKLVLLAMFIAVVTFVLCPSTIPFNNKTNIFSGTVYNVKGKNVDVKINTYNKKSLFPAARVRIYSDNNLNIADKIIFKATLEEPSIATNPGQFNYKTYLNNKGINYICYKPKIINISSAFSIKKVLANYRKKLLQPAKEKLSQPIFNLYSAMILGEKAGIDKEVYSYFQGAGLSHILVISGLHLSLLTMSLLYLLNKLKVKQKFIIIITLFFIWCYALITGFSVSIIRATLMLTIFLLSKSIYQVHKPLNTLCFVAVVMIIASPLIITNLSFQLSFSATAGILIIMPIVNKFFGCHKLVGLVGSVIAVQLISLPVIANSFYMFVLYAIPANLILSPLVTIILVLGVFSLVPYIGVVMLYPLSFILKISLVIARFFSQLPMAQVSLKKWSLAFTIFYIITLFSILVLIKLRKNKAVITVTLTIIIFVTFTSTINNKGLEITFLDVEQGDSAVLTWPNNYVMVIDGGQNNEYKNYGESVLVPYIRQLGINRINALVVSHSDNDHIGGLLTVAEQFKIDTLYISPQAYYKGNDFTIRIVDICLKNGTLIEHLAENDMIKIAANSYIEVYSPIDTITEDNNNTSIVLRVVYGKTSVLFTGDIEKETELRLTTKYKSLLQSQILKVPHHGSKSSSTQEFLEQVAPEIAVCSLGRNNRFGHPHKSIVERYSEKQIDFWRTDKNGAITVNSNGYNVKIKSYLGNKYK